MLVAVRARGASDNQLRLEGIAGIGLRTRAGDAAEEDLGGGASHFAQRLADGSESGVLIGGALNVVETDDGDIFGHAQAGFAESANGSHSGDVVEGEERRKGFSTGEQGLGGFVSELG